MSASIQYININNYYKKQRACNSDFFLESHVVDRVVNGEVSLQSSGLNKEHAYYSCCVALCGKLM